MWDGYVECEAGWWWTGGSSDKTAIKEITTEVLFINGPVVARDIYFGLSSIS